MFGLDLTQIGAAGLIGSGAIGLLVSNWATVKGWLPSLGRAASGDDNSLDFQALTRLQNRYVRLKCPEGQAAIQVCLTHFFHGDEGQP